MKTTSRPALLAGAAASLALCAASVAHGSVPTWTDPDTAAAEHPDFAIQGEYTGTLDDAPAGLQAAALDEGRFHVLTYRGGLPGEGWDESAIAAEILERDALQARLAGWVRVVRESPTLGAEPPEGALVVFAGKESDEIEGRVEEGLLREGARTTRPVGDFRLHIEYRLPYKPARPLGSQDRGNSGVYIYNNYEVQLLDSFGLDFDAESNAVQPASDPAQWNACLYKFKTADVPATLPPLQWQTYDIDFTAPRFRDGEKIANARITVRHNGIVVHDDVELPEGTGAGARRPEREKGLIHLQDHGNPVAFRNIWLLEK